MPHTRLPSAMCFIPNDRYNACITALARCGRWRQALAILDHMRFSANAAEASAATATAAAALKADPAARIDSGAAAVKSPPAPVAVRPDVFSYSAAITACGNCGEWRRALALLRVMREQGVPPNVRDVDQSTLPAGAEPTWRVLSFVCRVSLTLGFVTVCVLFCSVRRLLSCSSVSNGGVCLGSI